jgi:FkbM family methyltransferase
MRFLFKYPTRSRPDWFKETLKAYQDKLSGKHEHRFIVAMDTDDPAMNNPEMKNFLHEQNNLSYFYADHKTKIEACNRGIPDDGWDILVLVSDDMTPWVDGFDDIIAQDMQREFPGALDGALHYPDGFAGNSLLTYSIMGHGLYERIEFIYWPAYKGTWCDNDFMELTKKWGKYKLIEKDIIRHQWKKHGSDLVYDKGDSTYKEDKDVFVWRKARGFPVSFSQSDEDWYIRRYFKDKFSGRFLDIGAGDGVAFSNTKILYDMGFNGVAVEPSPNFCQAIRENFPGDRIKIVQAALTDKDGPIELYHTPDFTSTLSEEHKAKWENTTPYTKIGVDGICWNTLLTQYGCDFDFLNIDIEGLSIAMLSIMPHEYKYNAKMFCVEHDGQITAVQDLLCPYGFKVIHTNGENVILGK